VVDRPEVVDEAIDGNDEHAGIALLALVLNHPESGVVLPRIKQALVSPSAQTRANGCSRSATMLAGTDQSTSS
jgi:hypothetical protein